MNAPFVAPSRITAAEFERLARAGKVGKRVELRRGVIVEIGAQYFKASDVILQLLLALIRALESAGVPWKIHTGLSVTFADDFVPMPDIVVWDPLVAPPELLDGPLPGAAARFVVEVADSTLDDDLGEKLEDYAKAGVAEYWVADVRGRSILRHAEPQGDRYVRCEPTPFGAPAAWPTRPEIVVETGTLR